MQWIRGIAHIGANVGQEVAFYAKLKDTPVLLVEPLPHLIPQIQAEVTAHSNGHFHIAEVCCSDVDDQVVDFHVSKDPKAQASSLLAPGKAVEIYPWLEETDLVQVKTTTLDTLLSREFPELDINMLAIDTQGADLKVLEGARQTLSRCDGVYVEVSDEPLYENGCTFREIIEFMDDQGFGLYRAALTTAGWGNAFFKARKSPHSGEIAELASRNIAVGRPATASSIFREKLSPKLAVSGNPSQPSGYRSQGTRNNEWLEIDLESSQHVAEIVLSGPASRGRAEQLAVLVRDGADDSWSAIYDYAAEGRILTRFDRIPVGRAISGVRIESTTSQLALAQVMVIASDHEG